MKKLLLLFLALPLFFVSCSSDNDNDDDKGMGIMTLTGEAISNKAIALQWSKVKDAFGYQVFFQVEGEIEWQTSNFVMANFDGEDPATIEWEGTYFSSSTEYTIQVKAFRDSRESSVIAESNKIVLATDGHAILEPADPSKMIIGVWKLAEYRASVRSNKPQYDAKIEEYMVAEFGLTEAQILEYNSTVHFTADLKYSAYSDGVLNESGEYTTVDNILTIVGRYVDGEAINTVCGFYVQSNDLATIVDRKDMLQGEFQAGLKNILGDDYEGFVLETATLHSRFTLLK